MNPGGDVPIAQGLTDLRFRLILVSILLALGATNRAHALRPAPRQDGFRIVFPADEKQLTRRSDASLVGVADTSIVATVELTFPITRVASISARSSTYRRDGTLAIRSLLDDEIRVLYLEAVLIGGDGRTRDPIHVDIERAEERHFEKLWTSRTFEKWFQRVMRDSTVTRMEFRVHGLQVQRIKVADPAYRQRLGDVAVFRLSLEPGVNEFTLNAYNHGGKLVGTWVRQLYYQPRLAGLEKPPVEFQQHPFHIHEGDLFCSECHSFRPPEEQRAERWSPARSCYPCHQKLTEREYLHGPVATWSCRICHGTNGYPGEGVSPSPSRPTGVKKTFVSNVTRNWRQRFSRTS